MNNNGENESATGQRLPLRALLWLAQVLLFGVYLTIGIAVLALPVTQTLAIAPWAGHLPAILLKFVGDVDLAAGPGVLLSSVTRITSGVAALAASCSAALQGLAILFNVLFGVLPSPFSVNLAVFSLSLAMFGLSVFVVRARSDKALIAPWRKGRPISDMDLFAGDRAGSTAGRSKRRWSITVKAAGDPGPEISPVQMASRGSPFIVRQREGYCHDCG